MFYINQLKNKYSDLVFQNLSESLIFKCIFLKLQKQGMLMERELNAVP